MKLLGAALVMQVVLGLGVVAASSERVEDMPAVDVIASSEAQGQMCSGWPPCCDFDEDGQCRVYAFCWNMNWACN